MKKLFFLLLSIAIIQSNQSIKQCSSSPKNITHETQASQLKKLQQSLQKIDSKPLQVQLNTDSTSKMIKAYEQECKDLKKYNMLVRRHNKKMTLRIVTYNVHYWHDPSKKSITNDRMMAILKKIDADIVCLQEVTLGNPYDTIQDLTEAFNDLGYSYGGATTFSPYHGPYFGNIIFSKYKLKNIIKQHYNDGYKGKRNARSFVGATVLFNDYSVRIYCTHLDVYDKTGKRRNIEIKELIGHIAQNDSEDAAIFITGDFNDPRSQDYNAKTWKNFTQHQKEQRGSDFFDYTATALKNADYTDAYQALKLKPPFTSWTGTIIDFGYLRNDGPLAFKSVNFYFDAASDHLPIIFDLKVDESCNSKEI